jgi:hypothetical protein
VFYLAERYVPMLKLKRLLTYHIMGGMLAAKEAKSKTRVYCVVAILLVLCVSLTVFLSLELSQNNSLITEKEAVNIARPLITQYTAENNRTVANMSTTFLTSKFWNGTDWSNRPRWKIYAQFDRSDYTSGNPQYWIIGYVVEI